MNTGRIITALATILAIPAMAADAPGYFKIPGTETTMKIYGNATLDTAYDFKGATGPAGGFSESYDAETAKNQWDMTAATLTRFGFTTTTPSAYGDVMVKVEGDFASTSKKWDAEKGKNVPDKAGLFRLRHAYGTVGGWLLGLTTSAFVDPDGSPDYLDWDGLLADYYGASRVPQIRYTFEFNKQASLALAIEKNTTDSSDKQFGSALVAAFNYGDDWGHVRAAVGYQKYAYKLWDELGQDSASKSTLSWSLSGSANIGKDCLVAHVGVGDGQFGSTMGDEGIKEVGNDLKIVQSLQWDLGYTHNWTDSVRSNLFVSEVKFDKSISKGVYGDSYKTLDQIGVNTVVAVTKNFQLGAEYLYGQIKPFDKDTWIDMNGDKGKMTESKLRLQAKYNFF